MTLSQRIPKMICQWRYQLAAMLSRGVAVDLEFPLVAASRTQRGPFCLLNFHPNSLIRDAVKAYQQTAHSESKFELRLSEDVRMLHADPKLIETLVQHLLRAAESWLPNLVRIQIETSDFVDRENPHCHRFVAIRVASTNESRETCEESPAIQRDPDGKSSSDLRADSTELQALAEEAGGSIRMVDQPPHFSATLLLPAD